MKDIMTDELKSLMEQLMNQTNKDKKIRGILLCKYESGMIVPSNIVIGNEIELSKSEIRKMICPENTIEVGTFRSYPAEQRMNIVHISPKRD